MRASSVIRATGNKPQAAAVVPMDVKSATNAISETTGADLARQISLILAMPPDELAATWSRHCRGRPPPGLPRSLLARLLAYRVQAEALGDLSPDVRRFLDRVSKEIAAGNEKPDLQCAEQFRLKPGTVLVREHGGAEHRVMVLADGFAWNGQVQKSLSAVATAITGTKWNGPRFFGIDNAGKARANEPQGERGPISAGPNGHSGRRKTESRTAAPADTLASGDVT